MKVLVAQSFLTFCNFMNCSPPDSSVHGILMEFLCKYVILGIMEFIEFYGILMELWHFSTFYVSLKIFCLWILNPLSG